MNPRFLFLIIFGVVVLGGMFFVFKPGPHPDPLLKGEGKNESPLPRGEGMKENGEGALSPTISTEKSFTLEVKGKELVSGPKTLAVTEGDTVTITISSDEAEELHVHGYDTFVDLEANKPAKLTFVADKTGHFPYELELSGTEIGALEVQPK